MRLFDLGGFQLTREEVEIVAGELQMLGQDEQQSDLRRSAFRKVAIYLMLFSKAL